MFIAQRRHEISRSRVRGWIGGFAAAHSGKPLAFRRMDIRFLIEALPPHRIRRRSLPNILVDGTVSRRLTAMCGGTAAKPR